MNGVIADNVSLDEILAQENSGSGQLMTLKAHFVTPDTPQEPQEVIFSFTDADANDDEGTISVRYTIRGNSRDWVFVTSSLIEERIAKVKRFAPNELFARRRWFTPLLGIFVVTLLSVPLIVMDTGKSDHSEAAVAKLKQAWQEKAVKDPVEAIVLLEEAKQVKRSFMSHVVPVLVPCAILTFLLLLFLFFVRYYPIFNFCWGDYVEVFQRKEASRKFWLVVIGIGFVISVLGSLVANFIKL
jgi:hypothetical protein